MITNVVPARIRTRSLRFTSRTQPNFCSKSWSQWTLPPACTRSVPGCLFVEKLFLHGNSSFLLQRWAVSFRRICIDDLPFLVDTWETVTSMGFTLTIENPFGERWRLRSRMAWLLALAGLSISLYLYHDRRYHPTSRRINQVLAHTIHPVQWPCYGICIDQCCSW